MSDLIIFCTIELVCTIINNQCVSLSEMNERSVFPRQSEEKQWIITLRVKQPEYQKMTYLIYVAESRQIGEKVQ